MGAAVHGGDFYLSAKASLYKRDRDFAKKVIVLSLEKRMGFNTENNIQITVWSSVCAGLSLTGYFQSYACVNACRYF